MLACPSRCRRWSPDDRIATVTGRHHNERKDPSFRSHCPNRPTRAKAAVLMLSRLDTLQVGDMLTCTEMR
jgi:hypothetical protein